MSDLSPDVVARGRAIFERLRGATTETDDDAALDEEHGGELPTAPPPVAPADEAPPSIDDAIEAEPAAVEQHDAPVEAVIEPPPGDPAAEESPLAASEPLEAPASPIADPDPLGDADAAAATTITPSPPTEGFAADETPVEVLAPPMREVPAAEGTPSTPDARLARPALGRFARPLPRVLAVANQKGGVGKTTTTVNLAACLAELGFRVLVVDLDPQGNASTGLGINIRDLATSMYDVLLHDAELEDCVEPTSVRNLFVAPANLDLAGAEIELVPAFSRELKLRAALEAVRDDYDYVLVDCPPSLGLLTVNSLAAASEVLVPIQCEYYALEGLGQLLRNVGLVQKNLNPTLEVSVIVCVMYDARTKLADQVVQEVRAHFGDKVCRTVIPRTVRLSEAPSYGQPISAFDPTSRGAIAYRELAKEVSGGGTPQRPG